MNSIIRMPIIKALMIQLLSCLCITPLVVLFPSQTIPAWILLQAILAAVISHYTKMAYWWIPMQLMFLPAIAVALTLEISPMWFGVCFFLLFLVYGKTFKTQVPLYLSSSEATKALASLLPRKKNFTFIDLGCGCGGLLSTLHALRGNGNFYGIEAAPIPFLIGKARTLFNKANCNIQWGDLWKQDLAHYDVVYAYLSPVPMSTLWEKVCQEMQPGSLFISNTFAVPGIAPEKIIRLNDFSGSALYIWRI
ncbi:MAG: class I SAM-dependent methyltransferase [Nitrosomonas sp.]|nr:class I SAM-dependent methyltransferase [Nitrosomonas sp.]MCP5252455.1 class I SAM-dependent methyltransferase [Burkholderiales bacterium]